jgi:hypothetical protein
MSKTVKSVKNSLKFKAQVKEGLLSVRVGVKKYTLPISARILSNGKYLFLSFPATSELFEVGGDGLVAMSPTADATEAYASLNPGRRRGGRKRGSNVEIPSGLAEALKAIPAGHKLVFDASGNPRIVKMRKRRK